jgi:L-fuculose-phosphate aldolase
MNLKSQREQIVRYGQKLSSTGLVSGTGGNLSIFDRNKNIVAVSPSAVDYNTMTPGDVVLVNPDGTVLEGDRQPTSELNFHLALYHHRKDTGAVVHTHSPYATAFACLGMEIPAVHYLIGFSRGRSVPVAPYATFGTQALADAIIRTIGEQTAVLLAHHGLVTVGPDIEGAFAVAEAVEYVAKILHLTLSVGQPVILNESQMTEVMEKFKTYGKR